MGRPTKAPRLAALTEDELRSAVGAELRGRLAALAALLSPALLRLEGDPADSSVAWTAADLLAYAQGRRRLEGGASAAQEACAELAAAGLAWREEASSQAPANPWEVAALAALGREDLEHDRPTSAPRLAALASCSTQLVWAAAAAGQLRRARSEGGYQAASCRRWLQARGIDCRLRGVDDGAD